MSLFVTEDAFIDSSDDEDEKGEEDAVPYIPLADVDSKSTLTVLEGAKMLKEKRQTALVIGRDASAIFTEKDILQSICAKQDTRSTLLSEISTRDPVCVGRDCSMASALRVMHSARFRHLPVLQEDTMQIVDLLDIVVVARDLLSEYEGLQSRTKRLLQSALSRMIGLFGTSTDSNLDTSNAEEHVNSFQFTRRIVSVKKTDTVLQACSLMMQKEVTGILVVGEDGGLVGIFTESDLVRRVVAEGFDPTTCPMGLAMTPSPKTVRTSEASSMKTLSLMLSHGFRHIPVVDDDMRPAGMLDVMELAFGVFGKGLGRENIAQAENEKLESCIAQLLRGVECFKMRASSIDNSDPPTQDPKQTAPGADSCDGDSKFAMHMRRALKNKQRAEASAQGNRFDRASRFYAMAITNIKNAAEFSSSAAHTKAVAMASSELYARLGDVQSIEGDLNEAVHNYTLSLDSQFHVGCLSNLISVLIEKDEFELAGEKITLMAEHSADHTSAACQKLSVRLQELCDLGSELQAAGEFQESIVCYTSALRLRRKCTKQILRWVDESGNYGEPDVLCARARSYIAVRDIASAREDYRACTETFPYHTDSWLALAASFESAGKSSKALEILLQSKKHITDDKGKQLVSQRINALMQGPSTKELDGKRPKKATTAISGKSALTEIKNIGALMKMSIKEQC